MENQINEEEIKKMAANLRRPDGDFGIQVGKRMNEGNRPMNLHTLAVVNAQPHDKILEIGMGNGLFVKNILKMDPSIEYNGCDFSETMISEATAINAEFVKNGQAEFVHSNIDHMPFKDGAFNKVFTVNTLYFWEKPSEVLKELRRVLSNDGSLIISVRPKNVMEKYPVTKYGFTLYSKEEIIKLLESNGFKAEEVTEVIEPPQELWGNLMPRETLVIKSGKN